MTDYNIYWIISLLKDDDIVIKSIDISQCFSILGISLSIRKLDK